MSYPFIQARHYTKGRIKKIRLIVIHDMEAPEASNTAENVSRWFAGSTAPQASCHYCVDNNSIVQNVKLSDTAWHCPNANADGIGVEHAGYAKQTRTDWTDAFSRAELARSAKLTAKLAKDYSIAIKHLTVAELKAGKSGFIGHWDATVAYSGGRGHTDPGKNFPWDVYMTMVQAEFDALKGSRWTKSRISAAAAALGVALVVFGGVTQMADPVVVQPAISKTIPTPVAQPCVVAPKPVVKRTLLVVNGVFDSATIKRLQQWANVTPDGDLGINSWRHIQSKVGVTPSGTPNYNTWIHLQRMVGAYQDGNPGPKTYAAIQRFLNTH